MQQHDNGESTAATPLRFDLLDSTMARTSRRASSAASDTLAYPCDRTVDGVV
jgi:hypothetical protein